MARPNNMLGQFPAPRLWVTAISGRWLLAAVCVPILLFLLVPILIIVPMALTKGDLLTFPPDGVSIRPFLDFFGDTQWVASTVTSLKVAILAMAVSCTAGGASAVALHRNSSRLKGTVATLILMPLMIPVVVLALGDYLFLARLQLIGAGSPSAWRTVCWSPHTSSSPCKRAWPASTLLCRGPHGAWAATMSR